ncbi:MAG TPA: hypothetical protein VNZ62_19925 [Capillimicrobium sp.]|nr:hypothetical protein [Capillimicrobium sp.]
MPRTVHLHPTAELAPRVIAPDDPGQALALAQALFEETPRMFNHHRGLWGYTGAAAVDGEPLTVQATGIGGPSAAVVVWELAALGATRVVRVGACAATGAAPEPGTLVLVEAAVCGDGASRALGCADRVAPDARLLAALRAAAPRAAAGAVLSRDLFYGGDAPAGPDVLGVDLETAAVLAAARERGLAAAAVLEVGAPEGSPGEAAGRVAASALAAAPVSRR